MGGSARSTSTHSRGDGLGAALYLRGRPLAGVALIGVGSAFKLVAAYVLVVLLLYELLRAFLAARHPPASAWTGRLAWS